MYNPPHPGKIVKKALIDGAGLKVFEAAEALGTGRVTMSRLINGHIGVSPEMALRLSFALGTSSKMWLNMQASYDLWKLRKKEKTLSKKITRIKARPTADHAVR